MLTYIVAAVKADRAKNRQPINHDRLRAELRRLGVIPERKAPTTK